MVLASVHGSLLASRRIPRAAAMAIVFAAFGIPNSPQAQTQRAEMEEAIGQYLAAHPEALASAIEKHLASHPEAIRNALLALAAKRATTQTAAAVDAKQAIAENATALFAAPLQTTVGAAEGNPTIVEFFDFNCGFCRKALSDMLTLLADEPGLRIVLKELPFMGADSVDAAKIAIAVQIQRPGAAASLEFHRRLLSRKGRIDRSAALAVAGELGFDTAQLEKHAASAEVNDALQQNVRVASALGIRGTPGYVVGESVIPGAVGATALKARIAAAKKP